MKKAIDSFTIGGTKAGPSMPDIRLQSMLGKRIAIDMCNHELHVPTPHGVVIASQGDRIILYDDNTLDVEKHDGACDDEI